MTAFDLSNPSLLLLIGLIIFFAYFIRSLTGFGSALICVPLLALWLDLKFVIPLVSLFEVGISLLLIKSVYGQISRQTVLPMIIGAVIGVILGSTILTALADEALKKGLGLIIILFALNLLRGGSQQAKPASPYWGGLAGGLGGLLGGLFGTSGPPYVMYLSYRLSDKTVLRASLIGLFTVEQIWRAGVFAAGGLVSLDMLKVALLLTPALIVGAILGDRVHLGLSDSRYRQLVAAILLISGVILWQQP